MVLRILIVAALLWLASVTPPRAQVPDVTASCVDGPCRTGGVSEARQRQLDRLHARAAREDRAVSEVEHRWHRAVKIGNDLFHKGKAELARGDCAAALADFQKEFAVLNNADLTTKERITYSNFYSRLQNERLAQEQALQHSRSRLAEAQACAQRQPLQTQRQGVAAAPAPRPVQAAQQASGQLDPRQSGLLAAYARSHPLIGAGATVRGNVYWLTDGGVKVPISSGTPVYLGQRIVTGEDGHLQILLKDETAFTIGDNSDMVLDEFVYDPSTKLGKVAASIVKGTFRFVTGKIAHNDPDQIRVKMAVGTIGIRGTDFEVNYKPGAESYINLARGELLITPKSGSPFPMLAGDRVAIGADSRFRGGPVEREARLEGPLRQDFDFIQKSISDQGPMTWKVFAHDSANGRDWTYERRDELSRFRYDLPGCRLLFHEHVSGKGSIQGDADVGVPLRDPGEIVVDTLANAEPRLNALVGHPTFTARQEPVIYSVVIYRTDRVINVLYFYDQKRAAAVANAFRHAASTCGSPLSG